MKVVLLVIALMLVTCHFVVQIGLQSESLELPPPSPAVRKSSAGTTAAAFNTQTATARFDEEGEPAVITKLIKAEPTSSNLGDAVSEVDTAVTTEDAQTAAVPKFIKAEPESSDASHAVSAVTKIKAATVDKGPTSPGVVQCQDMENHKSKTTSKPVWIAGFPGSGNDLLRTLVQKITGFEGRDVYGSGHCPIGRSATCKTHFPVFTEHPPLERRDEFHQTAALLLRNPAKSLPSYFNFVWEFSHKLQDLSEQAPEAEWIKWRDNEFDQNIRQWQNVLTWWFEHWEVETVIPYERIVSKETGPAILKQLAGQLEDANLTVATDLQCQWQWCVEQSATVKRAGHKYKPSFRPQQKQTMLDVVKETLVRFSNHSVLPEILAEYLVDIESNTPADAVPAILLNKTSEADKKPTEPDSMSCKTMENQMAMTRGKPVWIAGFPGSGNDLMRTLVHKITGVEGRDVYIDQHCPIGRSATCKTHWPFFQSYSPLDRRDEFHQTAALLLRNPAKSIPSYFNFVWEAKHKMQDHSEQAPEEEYMKWRDSSFDQNIRQWQSVVTWWLENWDVETVIPYERIVSKETGPAILKQLGGQLQDANFTVAKDLQCQWHWCVEQSATVKRAGHKYTPSFLPKQKQTMLDVIKETLVRFSNHTVLSEILAEYLVDIESNTPVDAVPAIVLTNTSEADRKPTKPESMSCQTMENQMATTRGKPVWIAGFPGSGNDLMRTLVHKITGVEGRDVYIDQHCPIGRSATCKTHWPFFPSYSPLGRRDEFHQTAALLLRNPAKSIPSYFNFLWETEHKIQDHSEQAPEEEYMKWRDISFDQNIRKWQNVVTWWLENWDVETVIPYERIVSKETGPAILKQLAGQLQNANFTVAKDLQCQWQWCVEQSATVKRAGHKYTPSFLPKQKQTMLDVIKETLVRFSNHTVLSEILAEYLVDIERNTPVDAVNRHAPLPPVDANSEPARTAI